MNIDFFEALKEGMGASGFAQYMDTLAIYLGPFGILMNMTCKHMKTFPYRITHPRLGGRYILSSVFENTGNLELVKWWYDGGNYLDTYESFNSNIDIVKWKLSEGIQETGALLRRAANNGNREMVEYCLEKRFPHLQWYIIDNVEMLDYLYRVRKLPLVENMWSGGFILRSEEVYVWAMQYQDDPMISLYEYFKYVRIYGTEWYQMVQNWVDAGFTKTQMMSRICRDSVPDDAEDLPLDICRILTYPVAKAIPSNMCECKDPGNHENKKRHKRGSV